METYSYFCPCGCSHHGGECSEWQRFEALEPEFKTTRKILEDGRIQVTMERIFTGECSEWIEDPNEHLGDTDGDIQFRPASSKIEDPFQD